MFAVNLTLFVRENVSTFLGLSNPARLGLLVLNIALFVVGFTGNGVVLIASRKYKAIKMDKVSMLFLENIAVADLLIVTVKVLPRVTVLAYDGWQLGPVVCFASVSLKVLLLVTENLLTTSLACYRLHVLRAVFSTTSSHVGRILVTASWTTALIYILILVMGAEMVAFFSPFMLGCGSVVVKGDWVRFKQIAAIAFSFLPIVIILVTNIWILWIAGRYTRKHTGQKIPSKSALTIVACICWSFLLSWTPWVVIWVNTLKGAEVAPVFVTIAEHFVTINAVINPFIYTTTNTSFRGFLMDLLTRRVSWSTGMKHHIRSTKESSF